MPEIKRFPKLIIPPLPKAPTIQARSGGFADCKACGGSGVASNGNACYPCSVMWVKLFGKGD